MGKSFRDTIVDIRSVSYKTGHNHRGLAREMGRHSHHSHRVANQSCSDDCTFVPFNKKISHSGELRTFKTSHQRSNVYHDPRDLLTFFSHHGWEGGNLEQSLRDQLKDENMDRNDQLYIKKSVKQIERRGSANKFTGHDRYSEKIER